MSLIRSILSMALTLVIPLALLVVGGVAALGVAHREPEPRDVRGLPSPIGATSLDDEDAMPLDRDVEPTAPETLVLRGKGGHEVAKLIYHPDGGLSLEPIGSDSRRFVVELRPPTHVEATRPRMFGAANGLEFRWRDDGSVEVRGIDRQSGDTNTIRIGPDGKLATESIPGAVERVGTLQRVQPVQP
jgi:hypothetical protein